MNTVKELLDKGLSMDQIYKDYNILTEEYYGPSQSEEYFDGEYFYNKSGQKLRNPSSYNTRSEGYTPFGDE